MAKKGEAKIKQKGSIRVIRVIGFIACVILLIGMVSGLIFAASYRYNAWDIRRAIASMDSGYIEISPYILPYVRNIENAVESLSKGAAVFGVAFAFMLFLQITLLLFMLSLIRDVRSLNVNNDESDKAAEEATPPGSASCLSPCAYTLVGVTQG
jgi:hypothetical protein